MSIARARSLRRQLSPAEARLWNALRDERLKPWHFRRQIPVGPFYADFASRGARLIVEVDGSGHFTDQAAGYDARRDAFLRAEGYRVLRVTSSDVLSRLDCVYAAILAALSGRRERPAAGRPTHHAPRGPPSPPGRRGGMVREPRHLASDRRVQGTLSRRSLPNGEGSEQGLGVCQVRLRAGWGSSPPPHPPLRSVGRAGEGETAAGRGVVP